MTFTEYMDASLYLLIPLIVLVDIIGISLIALRHHSSTISKLFDKIDVPTGTDIFYYLYLT